MKDISNDIHLKIAAPYKRLFAALIDVLVIVPLIIAGISAVNTIFSLPVTPEFSRGYSIKIDSWTEEHLWQIIVLYSLVKLVIIGLYFAILEASAWQGTIGKKIMNLKVTDTHGKRISYKRATGRLLGKILSTQLLIGYIMIMFTTNKQGLHDILAKTLVLEK